MAVKFNWLDNSTIVFLPIVILIHHLVQKFFIAFSISVLSSIATYSQDLVATVTPAGTPSNIQGMMIGVDVFLSMNVQGSQAPFAVMINPDGEQRTLDLSAIGANPLVAGVKSGDSTFFYFLKQVNKVTGIASMVLDNQTDKSHVLPYHFDVPGEIYGSYIEGQDMFMLCGVKNEYKLRLLQFRAGKLFDKSEFPLTFNLGKSKTQRITFFDMANPVTPSQAVGHVKICKDGRTIWILVDEPKNDRDVTQTEKTLFRTTAVKLNLDTKQTTVKSFYESEPVAFTSHPLGNDVYRLVLSANGFRVDQFNFNTAKKVNSVILEHGTEPGRDSTYARLGGLKTEKNVKRVPLIKRYMGSFLIVDSLSNGERVFTIGDYGDNYSSLPFVAAPFPIVGLILTSSSLIVGELVEGRLSTSYSYYRGWMNKGVHATYQVPFLRKVVDDYDYNQLKRKVRLEYRGYINLPTATFEITQQGRLSAIEIRKFQLR
ncbi:MAG TPA: hypothetical protein VK658_11900 [Chryseolinea sp.]|nr:hypothetical protein [Chryseolinea sp.]